MERRKGAEEEGEGEQEIRTEGRRGEESKGGGEEESNRKRGTGRS